MHETRSSQAQAEQSTTQRLSATGDWVHVNSCWRVHLERGVLLRQPSYRDEAAQADLWLLFPHRHWSMENSVSPTMFGPNSSCWQYTVPKGSPPDFTNAPRNGVMLLRISRLVLIVFVAAGKIRPTNRRAVSVEMLEQQNPSFPLSVWSASPAQGTRSRQRGVNCIVHRARIVLSERCVRKFVCV
jgi:hypothetical protein